MCFLINPPTVPKVETDFLNACSLNAMIAVTSDRLDSTCLTFTTKVDDGAMIKPPPNDARESPEAANGTDGDVQGPGGDKVDSLHLWLQ